MITLGIRLLSATCHFSLYFILITTYYCTLIFILKLFSLNKMLTYLTYNMQIIKEIQI